MDAIRNAIIIDDDERNVTVLCGRRSRRNRNEIVECEGLDGQNVLDTVSDS